MPESEGREKQEEERRKGGRPCLEMGSLTGILMHLNLCISSVCSPERGVGGDQERGKGERKRKREERGVRVEVKEGSCVEEGKSKTMYD